MRAYQGHFYGIRPWASERELERQGIRVISLMTVSFDTNDPLEENFGVRLGKIAEFFGRAISLKAMKTPIQISSFVLSVCLMVSVGAVHAQTPRSSCDKVDWSTLPSRFTHDPAGQRVHQYAEKVEPVAQERSDFQRSGFRQFRSSIQVGSSADNMHIVEQWGNPVQPYEAWRFPYRPYGVPYDQWGPNTQFWGANPFWPGGYWPNPIPPHPLPVPAAGNHAPMGDGMIDSMPSQMGPNPPGAGPQGMGHSIPGGHPHGSLPPGYYPPPAGYWQHPHGTAPWNPGVGPWTDGYYQDAPRQPRLPDRQFFYTPGL